MKKIATDPGDLVPDDSTGGGAPPHPGGPKGSLPSGAGNDLMAGSLAVQGRPLPILWGTRKMQAYVLEKLPPFKAAPPKWVDFPGGNAFPIDFIVQSDGKVYLCVQAGLKTNNPPAGTGTASTLTAVETYSIPPSPYQLTVVNGATWTDSNLRGVDGVFNITLNKPMDKVDVGHENSPNVYSVAAGGVYAFNAADATSRIKITYSYTTTDGIFAEGNGLCWKYLQAMPIDIYTQKFICALCEGEIKGAVDSMFWDKEKIAVVSPTNPGRQMQINLGLDSEKQVYLGGLIGPSEPFDSSVYQHTVLLYPQLRSLDQAYGVYSLTQAEVPQIAPIMNGVMFGSDTQDVNPADIVNELLTHTRRGIGLPASRVDTSVTGGATNSFRTYCDAAGFRFSVLLDSQRSALDVLAEILTATNSDAVWSGGALKIVPLGDQPIASPVYGSTGYVPTNVAQFNLGTADFLDTKNPIRVTRRPDEDCFNSIPVQYVDRGAFYASTTVEDPAQDDVEVRGGVIRGKTVALSFCFPNGNPAIQLSRIFTQRSLGVRNTYTFRLPWKYILLEPTDIVTLTDATAGYSLKPVRITKMSEAADGTLSFTAEDYPAGVAAAVSYSPQQPDGYASNDVLTRAQLPTTVDSVGFGAAPGALESDGLSYANFDNLWPNPTSEVVPPAGVPVLDDGSKPEWDYRFQAGAGVAYAGKWVRQLPQSNGGTVLQLTLPCHPNDQFFISAQTKRILSG